MGREQAVNNTNQNPRRAELLRRIDAAEFDATHQPAKVTPANRMSEGTRTAQAINEALRTGAIRQQPAPQPQHRPMTADRYLLRTNPPIPTHPTPLDQPIAASTMPTLRATGSTVVPGNTAPRRVSSSTLREQAMRDVDAISAHYQAAARRMRQPQGEQERAERRATWLVLLSVAGIYLVTFLAVVVITLYSRTQG